MVYPAMETSARFRRSNSRGYVWLTAQCPVSVTCFWFYSIKMSLMLMLGPVRISDLATVFPAGLTAAAACDRSLIYQRGRAIGAELRGKSASVHLG
jgi:hypothetical protein